MLTKCKIALMTKDRGEYSYNAASLFHGWLMEMIGNEQAGLMHRSGPKPYSQFLRWEEDQLVWNISTCTKEARESIIDPILSIGVKEVSLRHKDSILPIVTKSTQVFQYAELVKNHLFGEGKRYLKIEFLSPVSFKSQGRYLNYPSLYHIYQSLMLKHDAYNQSYETFDEDVLQELAIKTEIMHYKLRSYHFHLEGVRIPAFIGEVGLRLNMNQNMINLARFLFSSGEFTGIGIKTSLGMGAMRIVEKG